MSDQQIAEQAIRLIREDQAAVEPLEPDEPQNQETPKGGAEIFPPPTSPMAVARKLQPGWEQDGQLTLRCWRHTWMRWHRAHWAEVDEAEVKATLYRRLEHAQYLAFVKGEPEQKPWAPTKRKISDLLDATAAITILPTTVDSPSWTDRREEGVIVACRNGLLRVGDRKLLDHDPRFFNLVSVPFDYDPAAPEPTRWLEFLADTWTDEQGQIDQDSINLLQEFFGYVVSGRTHLHKILLIIGPTRSGKGTIARVLTSMIGKGNMAGPTLASLATNFGLSPLMGKPLAIVSDARLAGGSSHQVVERLLTISGEDTIDIDRKYKDPWTGRLPTRFMILSNELPNFGDASGAIAHRFMVLTMTKSWLGKENTALTKELTNELPGILNWALDGLARLAENGRFTEPVSSVEAVVSMKDSASPISAFVRECCEVGRGLDIAVDELWTAWKDWCEENGRDRPGTKQQLSRNLQAVVPQIRVFKPHGEPRRYSWIRLADENKTHNGLPSGSSGSAGSPTSPPPAAEPSEPLEPLSDPLLVQHSTPVGCRRWLPAENRLCGATENLIEYQVGLLCPEHQPRRQ